MGFCDPSWSIPYYPGWVRLPHICTNLVMYSDVLLHIIDPDAFLQSLVSRQNDVALSFLSKLLGMSAADKLTAMIPALQYPLGQSRTRPNPCVLARHSFQLSKQLSTAAPNLLCRALQHCRVHIWNTLLPSFFFHAPCLNDLQSFKESVHHHLWLTRWLWTTDCLWLAP